MFQGFILTTTYRADGVTISNSFCKRACINRDTLLKTFPFKQENPLGKGSLPQGFLVNRTTIGASNHGCILSSRRLETDQYKVLGRLIPTLIGMVNCGYGDMAVNKIGWESITQKVEPYIDGIRLV